MKINKNLGLTFLLISILNFTQAEYTAKVFIEGLSMGTGGTGGDSILPPSDPTEQTQGDANFLVKLSRTTAYQGEPVSFIVESNSEDCFYVEFNNIYTSNGYLMDSCMTSGDLLPFSRDITSSLALGINTITFYQFSSVGDGDPATRTETITLNILTPPEEENSDGNLKYNVSRRSLPVAENVFINFYENTYDCVGLKHIESGQLIDWGYCGVQDDYISFSPKLALDSIYQSGTQNFSLIGYQGDVNGEPIDGTITDYYFAINMIPEATPPVITDDTYLEINTPIDTFDSVFFGPSTFAINRVVFGLINADTIAVSDDNGYIVNVSQNSIGDGENPFEIQSYVSTTVDLIASATNENGTTTRNFSYFMNRTSIDEIDIKWCRYQAEEGADCDVSQGSAAIWDGGTGDSFSFTFRSDNAECVTVSSSNDPNYTTPVTRCYYDNPSANFDVSYPNHDPVGRSEIIYNYQIRATNSNGEDFTKNFSFKVYYD